MAADGSHWAVAARKQYEDAYGVQAPDIARCVLVLKV